MNLAQARTVDPARERVREFAERVFRRSDAVDEVVPTSHQPDWGDRPTRFRAYPGRTHIALPGPMQLQQRFDAVRASRAANRGASLADLSLLLYLTLGPLHRKLDITWNNKEPLTGFLTQEFGRGSASGGGLYPTQLYLVAGAGMIPGAGVYHYSAAEHALTPVRHGRCEALIAQAVGDSGSFGYYLVLASDFWSNCFKYHNFGIHVCSQDAGVVMASVQVICDVLGIEQRVFTVFEDARANQVIGADGVHESVFAVVALGEKRGGVGGHGQVAARAPVPQPWQKSRRVRIPETLRELHQLTMLDGCALASLVEGGSADRWATPPAAGTIEQSLRSALPSVLRARRSAWGSLHSVHPMGRDQLLELLSFAWRRAGPEHAPMRETLPEAGLGLVVQVNRAGDVPCGAYRFDPQENTLVPIKSTPLDRWQLTYSMTNYNIDEAACILFVTGNLEAVMQRYGARGYRLLNIGVGMLAQLVYVGASALRLDCGVVLGVRAQHVKRSLGLPGDENVCLAAYLSQQQQVCQFNHSLLPDVPDWREIRD